MNDRIKAIIYMLGGSLAFSLMSASAKFTKEIPLIEKLFVRNLFATTVAFLIILKSGKKIKGNNNKLLVSRAVLGFIGAFCYFYAVNYLPLGDATLLNKVSPFFVIIMSAIFLSEKIQKHHIPVLLAGLTGAVLVLKPGFNYNFFAALMGLTSALLAGSTYAIIRHLRNTDSPHVILLYFSGISTLGTIPLMLFGSFIIPTGIEFLGLLSMGLFTAIAQFCINNAYRLAPAGDISVFDYTTILFSILIGLLIWYEIPDIFSLLGAFLIILAGIINYRINKTDEQLKTVQNQ